MFSSRAFYTHTISKHLFPHGIFRRLSSHTLLQYHRTKNHPFSIHPLCSNVHRGITTSAFFSSVPTPLIPPLAFTLLLVTLWTYKSLLLILLQNKIIYMPSVPPFSRSEKISDYASACQGVKWREERIRSEDGVELAMCVGAVEGKGTEKNIDGIQQIRKRTHVVVIYFQGNGSSLPPRLPALSSILANLDHHRLPEKASTPQNPHSKYTILALSYRGYWTSHGRPSERGITFDAAAILAYAQKKYPPSQEHDTRFVLWGQSLGAAVAVTAAAATIQTFFSRCANLPRISKSDPSNQALQQEAPHNIKVSGLILETPFTSILAMLKVLYPQKWLPYRYLGPFLWNHWDSLKALRGLSSYSGPSSDPQTLLPSFIASTASKPSLASVPPISTLSALSPRVLILQAEKDELVPAEHGSEIENVCRQVGMEVEKMVVKGALHSEVVVKGGGRGAITEFLQKYDN